MMYRVLVFQRTHTLEKNKTKSIDLFFIVVLPPVEKSDTRPGSMETAQMWEAVKLCKE